MNTEPFRLVTAASVKGMGAAGISPSHRWSISPPPVRSVIPGIGEMGNCIGEISSNIL